MGECYGPMAYFWLAVYVITIAITPKHYRIYTVNGLFVVAIAVRVGMEGFTQSIAASGAAFAILVVAVNAALWADNFDDGR